MDIAICDDSQSDALLARDIIKKSLKEVNISADIVYYDSAEDIKSRFFEHKETVDILILDIDMPEISGLELAEELRNNNLNLIIIFLTNHDEFVFRAIEFQPFRYIRKIKMNTEMPLAIQSAVKVIQMQQDKYISLHTDDGEIQVRLSEIICFEADKRKTDVHLSNGKIISVYRNITEFSEMLASEKFIMIHRCCGVNIDFIKVLKKDVVVLKNSEMLSVSRRKIKEVRQQIMKLWGDKI
ncbi:MAG: LytTR family DNA-binding domain-containing protein [Ruminococcus sp.]|nr:LytTR family DNA-binding domain-containing protein [Ruminococcus sp.]